MRCTGIAVVLAACLLTWSCGGDSARDSGAFTQWQGGSVDPDSAVERDADRRPLSYRLLGARAPGLGPADGDVFGDSWLLIDFWGMWCPDCLADAPHIAELADAIEEHPDIAFVSVHTPPSRSRASEAFGRWGSLENYKRETGYSHPVIVDDDASIRQAWRIDWTPTYLLVGPDRTIHAFRTDLGDVPLASLISSIEAIISSHGVE